MATVSAPDGRASPVDVEVKAHLEPRDARRRVEAYRERSTGRPLLVIGRYFSPATRDWLRDGGVGYLDLTGNVRLALADPGLYLETSGASEDPDREQRPARSLRGAKAGRIVRALVDRKAPAGVRALAELTRVDPGYASRVLAHLDAEALVTRRGRGRLDSVDWPALLRRWAEDAPLDSRGAVRPMLEPRGTSVLVSRLRDSSERYVVTGEAAAEVYTPIPTGRLAVVWIHDAAEAAERLGLRPAPSGASVLLVEPNDDVVFDGAIQRAGVWYAAPSQVAADLLSGPGRGPAAGEDLLRWMRENEDRWRR